MSEIPKKVQGSYGQLQNVIENPDGSVIIRFGNSRSIRLNPGDEPRRSTTFPQRNMIESSGRSTSSIEEVVHIPADSISRPTYRVVPLLDTLRTQSPPVQRAQSPTPSDFEYTESIYTLNNQYFTLDQTILNTMFNSEFNKAKRE